MCFLGRVLEFHPEEYSGLTEWMVGLKFSHVPSERFLELKKHVVFFVHVQKYNSLLSQKPMLFSLNRLLIENKCSIMLLVVH